MVAVLCQRDSSPTDVDALRSDPAKARRVLGWERRVSFAELVEMMVRHDINLARRERTVAHAWFGDPARGAAVRNSSSSTCLSVILFEGGRAPRRRPTLSAQLHLHDPWPLTAEAVPVLQRSVFGMLVMAARFADPHAPFTGGSEPAEAASRWTPVMAASTNTR
jgi:hypothetical protein